MVELKDISKIQPTTGLHNITIQNGGGELFTYSGDISVKVGKAEIILNESEILNGINTDSFIVIPKTSPLLIVVEQSYSDCNHNADSDVFELHIFTQKGWRVKSIEEIE